MSLFSYLDTRAPSTEEIMAVENEYDENGNVKEPTWIDTYELDTEFSLQRLASGFGTLSIVVLIVGIILSVWFAVTSSEGLLSAYSAIILVVGLVSTAVIYGLLRLARGFANYMLVRLLQNEEDD